MLKYGFVQGELKEIKALIFHNWQLYIMFATMIAGHVVRYNIFKSVTEASFLLSPLHQRELCLNCIVTLCSSSVSLFAVAQPLQENKEQQNVTHI